ETAIGERRLSLASVGALLAEQQLGSLDGRRVIVIGTGETSGSAARALARTGCRLGFGATRRPERAIALAKDFGAESMSFDELSGALADADLVVSATLSPHHLLEARDVAEVM